MSFEPVSKLDGHVAVITGGKGAIGWATARRLAALGARIVSIDRSDPEKVQALLDTLPKVASGAHFALTGSQATRRTLRYLGQQRRFYKASGGQRFRRFNRRLV
jgi:3-oxoacyl-[acyl-carrier protein] reductase